MSPLNRDGGSIDAAVKIITKALNKPNSLTIEQLQSLFDLTKNINSVGENLVSKLGLSTNTQSSYALPYSNISSNTKRSVGTNTAELTEVKVSTSPLGAFESNMEVSLFDAEAEFAARQLSLPLEDIAFSQQVEDGAATTEQ